MSVGPDFDRKAVNTAMAHWLNKTRGGEMTSEEMRALQVWLDEHPAHRARFDRMNCLWGEMSEVADDPAIIKSRERDVRKFDRVARLRRFGTIAAGAMLLAVCSWAVVTSGVMTDLGLVGVPKAQELRTSVGQRTTITLRDDFIVTLDTDTIVRLRETGRERRVELVRGRAFFQVAKDKSRPFIVVADGHAVRATGTAFDVRVDAGRLQVTLVEGRVNVRELGKQGGKSQSADMRAGWRLDIAGGQAWRVAPVNVNKETTWHDGRLSFFNDPLVYAVAEMNRYTERKITFRGPAPDVAVVGVFRVGDVDNFVKALELNRLARVSSTDEAHVELTE